MGIDVEQCGGVAPGSANFPKPLPDPIPEEPGESALMDRYVIRCLAPTRPGLPVSYCIEDTRGRFLSNTGNWLASLRWCRDKLGDLAADYRYEPAPDEPEHIGREQHV